MKRSIESDTHTAVASPQKGDDAPRTLAEVIYRKLRSDIVWGTLPPGAPLRSDELRATYNVGVSPLREALARLMAERLVTSVGQRGFRVATINASDVVDVTETRLIIEGAALTRSIRDGGVQWEAGIVASLHSLSRIPIPHDPGGQAENWTRHHRAFHLSLLSACGSSWQESLSSLLFDQAERFRIVRAMKVPNAKLSRDVMDEHKQIVDAALARDVKGAVEALDAHYKSTMRDTLAAIEGTLEVANA